MPLTSFQSTIASALAPNRSEESHLAGGAALHFAPNSKRFSNDLDYFHDSEERVATAFEQDRRTLENLGFTVQIVMNQPGFIRAIVDKRKESTKIEWSHDSAWRFMPAVKSKDAGYVLHSIDLAINKVLALAGRDEARDFIDILHIHEKILPLGALCWAAVGKDPGFSPVSLLDLLRRRGKYQPEEILRLQLAKPVDLKELKTTWLAALDSAEEFIKECAEEEEPGSLFYSKSGKGFVQPTIPIDRNDITLHFGKPGGVLPRL